MEIATLHVKVHAVGGARTTVVLNAKVVKMVVKMVVAENVMEVVISHVRVHVLVDVKMDVTLHVIIPAKMVAQVALIPV